MTTEDKEKYVTAIRVNKNDEQCVRLLDQFAEAYSQKQNEEQLKNENNALTDSLEQSNERERIYYNKIKQLKRILEIRSICYKCGAEQTLNKGLCYGCKTLNPNL